MVLQTLLQQAAALPLFYALTLKRLIRRMKTFTLLLKIKRSLPQSANLRLFLNNWFTYESNQHHPFLLPTSSLNR